MKISNQRKASCWRVASRRNLVPLGSASRAGGFDEACGFAALLAGIRIFDELKKRRFGHHAQKLLEASALCENFLQAPPEQSVEVETRRTWRADASNISLLSDVKPVAGEWNGRVPVRVGKVIDATEDRFAVWRSRRYPDQAVVLCVSQDHACVHA